MARRKKWWQDEFPSKRTYPTDYMGTSALIDSQKKNHEKDGSLKMRNNLYNGTMSIIEVIESLKLQHLISEEDATKYEEEIAGIVDKISEGVNERFILELETL